MSIANKHVIQKKYKGYFYKVGCIGRVRQPHRVKINDAMTVAYINRIIYKRSSSTTQILCLFQKEWQEVACAIKYRA